MNIETFKEEIKKLGIELTEEQLEKFKIYVEIIKKYNLHTNITRIIEDQDIYLKHFYDSLTILKANNLKDIKTLLDIGTGAGFPGMVIKIIYPNIKVTLLDSNIKKTKFLEELKKILDIKDITITHERAEKYAENNREKFDIVTSRAVANIITLSELSLPFLKIGGTFIALKGDLEKENNPEYAIKILGGYLEKTIKFNLPIENSIRNILVIKKINKTPSLYPRSYEKILKKPLLKS